MVMTKLFIATKDGCPMMPMLIPLLVLVLGVALALLVQWLHAEQSQDFDGSLNTRMVTVITHTSLARAGDGRAIFYLRMSAVQNSLSSTSSGSTAVIRYPGQPADRPMLVAKRQSSSR